MLKLWIFFFNILIQILYLHANLVSPFRWATVDDYLWYFEKSQEDAFTWIEFKDNHPAYKFKQKSLVADENGYPIVIIEKFTEPIVIKLTKRKSCICDNKTNNCKDFLFGEWIEKRKGDKIIPIKWASIEDLKWWFEKQADKRTWIEYKKNTAKSIFSEYSLDFDAFGCPVMILKKKSDNLFIRITEYKTYSGFNLTEINQEMTTGYWVEKSNVELVKPFRWTSSSNPRWYFEKQNESSWVEFNKKRAWLNFTQLSFDMDINGYPVVIIKEIKPKGLPDHILKLSGYMAYFGTDQNINQQLAPGYWSERDGKYLNLPRECQYVAYKRFVQGQLDEIRHDGIICENKFDDKMMRAFAKQWRECKSLQNSFLQLVIKPSATFQVVNESFGIFKLSSYLYRFKQFINIRFLQLKGFDIESMIFFRMINKLNFRTDFNLYRQNRLVRGCDGFNNSKSEGFIFQRIGSRFSFGIEKPKSAAPICALFFRNARLFEFELSFIANSYVIKNQIYFEDDLVSVPGKSFNAMIETFQCTKSYNIDLNSRFLNPRVFFKTYYFYFDSRFNSIDNDVFKPLTWLTEIYFNPFHLIELIRRQGIEWIKGINVYWNVSVNLSNETEVKKKAVYKVEVGFELERDFFLNKDQHFAYDHDFCLFTEFPFQQLVLMFESKDIVNLRKTSYSCTELWLYRFFPFFISIEVFDFYHFREVLSKSNFTACNFERRLELCKKSKYPQLNSNQTSSTFSIIDYQVIIELTLMITGRLLAVYGIINNLIIIYIIYHKNNIKTTREKHYVYMSLHCLSNTFICFIHIVSLVSECQYPFGYFCSSIRQLVGVQYIKIVFGECLNSVCRLLSNFTYLGFALCRMSRVGKDHGKLVIFINELSIKRYMIFCFAVSGCLSICKGLQFDINLDKTEYAFPQPFIQNTDRLWINKPSYMAMIAINAINDVINYFVFIFVHLVLDLILIKKMRRVLLEKEEKMREMKVNGVEKTVKESKESKRRVILMVILSSIFNLITKVPSMITSLNDVRLIIKKPASNMKGFWFVFNSFSTRVSFEFFCLNQKTCIVFQNFGNCLFLLSMCSTLHFFKSFDKNFKTAYCEAFPKKKKNHTNKNVTNLTKKN